MDRTRGRMLPIWSWVRRLMATREIEEAGDRLIIRFDPNGPIELDDLTGGLAALARLYARHYRTEADTSAAPRLFVTRLQTGSIIAEVAPYAMMFGQVIAIADQTLIVTDFTKRIVAGIKAFADPGGPLESADGIPSQADASDLREFIKPLAGRKGASLGLRRARFEQRDGDRETIAEYEFDEAEINRATVNIDSALLLGAAPPIDEPVVAEGGIVSEVMLFFEQASIQPGKERGRTADKGIIPDICDKPLPVYFRKSFQDLKDQMIKGSVNPLTNAFIVDVHVQRVAGVPRGYIVAAVHEIVPR